MMLELLEARGKAVADDRERRRVPQSYVARQQRSDRHVASREPCRVVGVYHDLEHAPLADEHFLPVAENRHDTHVPTRTLGEIPREMVGYGVPVAEQAGRRRARNPGRRIPEVLPGGRLQAREVALD